MNADLMLLQHLNVRKSREDIHLTGGDKFVIDNIAGLNLNLDSQDFEMDKNMMEYG